MEAKRGDHCYLVRIGIFTALPNILTPETVFLTNAKLKAAFLCILFY